MRSRTILLFTFATVLALVALWLSCRPAMLETVTADFSSQQKVFGPLDDCLKNSRLYSRNEQIESVCTRNYVHFYPRRQQRAAQPSVKAGAVRIGSFNLYHLGDGQAPAKSVSIVARIINRWDVVGVQELMPLPTEWAMLNNALFEMLDSNQRAKVPSQDWAVRLPGYLQILHELRTLDRGWALILQPVPEGEGNSVEMSGFYYRSGFVKLKELPHCPRQLSVDVRNGRATANYACNVQVPQRSRERMARNGFAAFFWAGNFDFIGVSVHARFRASPNAEERKAQAAEVCANAASPQACKMPQDLVGRLYEVKSIVEQFDAMERVARDNDVVFMGDFNIELKELTLPLWQAALSAAPGYTPYQTSPTSVGAQAQKLVSNYDHFILNAKAARECDLRSIQAYDLTQASPQSKDPVLRHLGEHLNKRAVNGMIDDYNKQIKRIVRPAKTSEGLAIRALNEKEHGDLVGSFVKACQRMIVNRHSAIIELISDHIPIEMTCTTTRPDDD